MPDGPFLKNPFGFYPNFLRLGQSREKTLNLAVTSAAAGSRFVVAKPVERNSSGENVNM